MTSTTHARRRLYALAAVMLSTTLTSASTWATSHTDEQIATTSPQDSLSARQQAIVLVAAAMAAGDMPRLNYSLDLGLDAGLTISDAREILVQLYAYVGFPRSLNALGELLNVIDVRKARGMVDAAGRESEKPIPTGAALLAAGKANQTKISGGPVNNAVTAFAPVINQFLQAHLFGDIFERDNLDWQSRELATVGALAYGSWHACWSHCCTVATAGRRTGRARRGRRRRSRALCSCPGSVCSIQPLNMKPASFFPMRWRRSHWARAACATGHGTAAGRDNPQTRWRCATGGAARNRHPGLQAPADAGLERRPDCMALITLPRAQEPGSTHMSFPCRQPRRRPCAMRAQATPGGSYSARPPLPFHLPSPGQLR